MSAILPARLPRYIRNLNTWAESFGLQVQMGVYPYDNDPEERLWAKWSGAREQLLALVEPVASYHLPQKCGRLVVPRGAQSARARCLLEGDVTVDGDRVWLEIDFGPPAYTLASHNAVETISYAEEIVHHGTPEALRAMGVPHDRLPARKMRAREFDGAEFERDAASGALTGGLTYTAAWRSVLQPDGRVLYRVDTSLRLRSRDAARQELWQRSYGPPLPLAATVLGPAPLRPPLHLRLIVDNTRPAPS